jgi:hypothetical protein
MKEEIVEIKILLFIESHNPSNKEEIIKYDASHYIAF